MLRPVKFVAFACLLRELPLVALMIYELATVQLYNCSENVASAKAQKVAA